MTNLNALQEALIPHLGIEVYQKMQGDVNKFAQESGRLKERINHLEQQMEGTNNKIRTLHKMAYGFRGIEFFKLKIMALHETNYVLVGGA